MTPIVRHDFATPKGRRIALTRLGLGTAPLGNIYASLPQEQAAATLAAAWDAGIRFFDTAPLYGLGLAETRLNHLLHGKPRADYALASKVGRLLRHRPPGSLPARTHYFDTPSREVVFDYGYDGVMRSVEHSLERLGADRFDILYVHDLGTDTHGSRAAADARLAEFLSGGMRALDELRSASVVDAIGAGCNEWEVCEALARSADVDVFLLAGRYTLLEQTAMSTFLPLCAQRGIGVVVGGPYNSGILAGGTTYNYRPAPAAVIERVGRLRAAAERHRFPIEAAALAFPLAHPAVIAVVPGAVTPDEVRRNCALFSTRVPAAFWSELSAQGLLAEGAPIPAGA